MSTNALIWWVILVVLVVVLVLAGLQALAAVREVRRLKQRIDGYADLPVLAPVRNGERNARRLEASLARVGPLMARADVAIARIRQGPIPPESIAAARRAWAALAALRSFAKR